MQNDETMAISADTPQRFRRLPEIVEAIQWMDKRNSYTVGGRVAQYGDFIVKDRHGAEHVFKRDGFIAQFEPIPDNTTD